VLQACGAGEEEKVWEDNQWYEYGTSLLCIEACVQANCHYIIREKFSIIQQDSPVAEV